MDKSSKKNERSPKVKINVKDRMEDDTIDLSLSELTEVPVREIAGIKRVTILDLSNNKLFSLGKNFATLTQIVKLDLSKNQIKYLPEDFGKLRNLRHLDLYNNRIEHLPLSFGDLQNLRYLDLKANPLAPALAKIVGPCLTSKDCRESARNTVNFLARMQVQVEKAKEKLQDENNDAQIEEIEDVKKVENQKPKKKKNKNKSKKNKNENQSPKANSTKTTNKTELVDSNSYDTEVKSRTVFKTLFIFFFLLGVNIIMLYIVTVKSPEIAEKLVGLIPPQYHDLIVTKTEDLRLNFLKISDWLQNFKTPTPMPSS